VRISRITPIALVSALALAACDNGAKQQLATVSHVDSLRVDSLGNVRKDLLEEVMTSTQFVNEINTELAKARSLAKEKSNVQLDNNSEMQQVNDERKRVVARITHLVAKLDSVQNRLAATRKQALALSKKDSTLLEQVAVYEKNIADLQASAAQERATFQKQIDQQTVQIASLNGEVDTLTHVRTDLTNQVNDLTAEKNTAYYVVGTREELIKKGVLVAEGGKRFFLVGSRSIEPARQLDPSAFTKIDRLADRKINLPAGEYQILSRQNPSFAQPGQSKDGKIAGSLEIQQPEQFWAPSRFLILVRS
jgi:predicted  nucleic acid-binding Zn-ribbon protein